MLWLILGLIGVLLKFWTGIPEETGLSALVKYVQQHQRSAIFSIFAYAAVVAVWYSEGISVAGMMLQKGVLSGWLVPIGYFSTALFDDIAKNFGKNNAIPPTNP